MLVTSSVDRAAAKAAELSAVVMVEEERLDMRRAILIRRSNLSAVRCL